MSDAAQRPGRRDRVDATSSPGAWKTLCLAIGGRRGQSFQAARSSCAILCGRDRNCSAAAASAGLSPGSGGILCGSGFDRCAAAGTRGGATPEAGLAAGSLLAGADRSAADSQVTGRQDRVLMPCLSLGSYRAHGAAPVTIRVGNAAWTSGSRARICSTNGCRNLPYLL